LFNQRVFGVLLELETRRPGVDIALAGEAVVVEDAALF